MSTQARQATAQIGGIPTVAVDVPVCAVLIAIFLPLAIAHMTLFRINRRRGHKFLFNYFSFGYAMTRVAACVFRLAWATRPHNVDISLVASIFLNAGILIVYVMNNVLAWRMVRSAAPALGWNRVLRRYNKVLLWGVLGLFIPLIVILVLRVKKPELKGIVLASKVSSRLATTYFMIIATLSAVLLAVAASAASDARVARVASEHSGASVVDGMAGVGGVEGDGTVVEFTVGGEDEKAEEAPSPDSMDPFGQGTWRSKVNILGTSIALAMLEAGFRCGTAWAKAPLASEPAWWDHKAAFYCFNFGVDVCILILLLVGRIDKRFHVPNGADGPGSYSRPKTGSELEAGKEGSEDEGRNIDEGEKGDEAGRRVSEC
jgi:hypothetical protein